MVMQQPPGCCKRRGCKARNRSDSDRTHTAKSAGTWPFQRCHRQIPPADVCESRPARSPTAVGSAIRRARPVRCLAGGVSVAERHELRGKARPPPVRLPKSSETSEVFAQFGHHPWLAAQQELRPPGHCFAFPGQGSYGRMTFWYFGLMGRSSAFSPSCSTRHLVTGLTHLPP